MRGFAGADRIDLAALDQLDFHVWYLAEAQHRVIRPACALDALTVKTHALFQHPARRLDRAALDLVDHAIRIDGLADVHRKRQLPHPDVCRAFDVGVDGAVGAHVLLARKASAVADPRLLPRLPACAPRGSADDVFGTLVAQMAQPERDGVFAAFTGDFVQQ